MKNFIAIIAVLFAAACAFPQEWRFVNTLDGVNLRSSPNGRKVGALKCNERVEFLGESDVVGRADGFERPWVKVRTKGGGVGYVFGAYLSASLEEAAAFRREEQLEKAVERLSDMERNLSGIRDWAATESPLCVDGAEFYFGTYESYENGRPRRVFSLHAIEFTADGCEDYPDFLPFRVGDDIGAVRGAFGEKSSETTDYDPRFKIEMWFSENIALNVKYSPADGRIRSVSVARLAGR